MARSTTLVKIAVILLSLASSSIAQQVDLSPGQKAILDQFMGDQEPTAKDAIWTSSTTFKVGVLDDGSRRDGYAQYVCMVAYEHGLKGHRVWVQVIDIVKLANQGDWEVLGESRCE